jgi:lipopolysaccharide export system permease protein
MASLTGIRPTGRLPMPGSKPGILPRIVSYILSQLTLATVALILTISSVIWLQQSLRFVDWMVNRGLPVSVFLYIAVLIMPNFLVLILPVALFATVLFIYNKLQTDSELVVMRAVGFGPMPLMAPALIVAFVATILGYGLTLYVLPTSYRAFKDLQLEMRNNYSGVLLQEGVFTTLDAGMTIYVREQGPHGELLGIMLNDERVWSKPITMTAKSGALVNTADGPRIVMVDGNRQELDRKDNSVSFLFFEHYTLDLARARADDDSGRQRVATERYLGELLLPDDISDPHMIASFRAEGHERLVSPLYIPAFVMIALAALLAGNFSRRGQALRVMAAIGIVIGLEAIGIGLAKLAVSEPAAIPLMYLNVLIPMAIAAYMLLGGARVGTRHEPDRA